MAIILELVVVTVFVYIFYKLGKAEGWW